MNIFKLLKLLLPSLKRSPFQVRLDGKVVLMSVTTRNQTVRPKLEKEELRGIPLDFSEGKRG